MQVLGYILSVLGIGVGFLAIVAWEGLLLASMPNGTPETLREIRWWMLGGGMGGLVALAAAVTLTYLGKPWLGAAAGAAPAVVMIVGLFVVALKP